MLNIAIVENEKEQSEQLRQYAERYAYEHGGRCRVTQYENGLDSRWIRTSASSSSPTWRSWPSAAIK